MADVFISYKSERRSAAQHLSRILDLNGYSVWFDYGLLSGTDFGRQIEREIRAAKAVIVLWCSLSRDSTWVLEEAHLAQKLGTFTPAWLERVDLPLGFGRADTIDLSVWDGAPRSHLLDRLLGEIARQVGRDPVQQFRGLVAYEESWRSFGAPSLANFALIAPLEAREEERLHTGIAAKEKSRAEAEPKADPTGLETEKTLFVSYPKDIAPAVMNRLVSTLIGRGFRVWLYDPSPFGFSADELVKISWQTGGGSFLNQTLDAIRAADAVLFLISPWTLKSKFQNNELSVALASGRIVPCIVDDGLSFDQLPAGLRELHVRELSVGAAPCSKPARINDRGLKISKVCHGTRPRRGRKS